MVLDLISIDTLVNTVISNYFGQVWIFGLAVIAFFIVVNLSLGIDFQGSIILSIPISLALVSSGLLSGYGWIGDAILVIAGLAYGFIVIRLLSK